MNQNATELVAFLDWDSAFFNLRIARIRRNTATADELIAIDKWCIENRIDCLYFLARSDDPFLIRIAQKHHFNFVDIRVTYSREVANDQVLVPSAASTITVRPAQHEDLPMLQRMARHNHTDTRFYADGHFPKQLCDELYETWITRSLVDYADMVLVADLGQGPVGYVSCHIEREQGKGSIGLIGVDKAVRGRGVGRAMVQQALEWFRSQRVSQAFVVTQGRNIAAQRLYQRLGFLLHSVELWYHKWYTTTSEVS